MGLFVCVLMFPRLSQDIYEGNGGNGGNRGNRGNQGNGNNRGNRSNGTNVTKKINIIEGKNMVFKTVEISIDIEKSQRICNMHLHQFIERIGSKLFVLKTNFEDVNFITYGQLTNWF